MKTDTDHMARAMELAREAASAGEVPVGAVVVQPETGEVIAEGRNGPIGIHDPTAHAEIVAIRQAGMSRRNYRLTGLTLYVTLEPCPMCAGAIVHGRLKRVVFGAYDLKTGAGGSAMQLLQHDKLNHQCQISGGVLEAECAKTVSSFFTQRRAQIKAARAAAKLRG